MKEYREAILGGTFDHFHRGHQALLSAAFASAEHVTIGLTMPPLYQKKFLSGSIESFAQREKDLKQHLQTQHILDLATIIPLTDIYGTSLIHRSIEAIFVTEVTHHNALLINEARRRKDFPPLKIHTVPFVHGSDGEIIASQRIRYGEIDRQGHVYAAIFKQLLVLPESLRSELSKPLGPILKHMDEVLKNHSGKGMFITVGDVVSQTALESNLPVAMQIIDYKNRRQILPHQQQISDIHNAAGTIDPRAISAYQDTIKQFFTTKQLQTIVIDGEEDLLALPAILLAPLGFTVLYGQYGEGIVINKVTEETKHKVLRLLRQFT